MTNSVGLGETASVGAVWPHGYKTFSVLNSAENEI